MDSSGVRIRPGKFEGTPSEGVSTLVSPFRMGDTVMVNSLGDGSVVQ